MENNESASCAVWRRGARTVGHVSDRVQQRRRYATIVVIIPTSFDELPD